ELLNSRAEDLLLDHGVIRSLELGVDSLGTLGEDLTHRGVVEYRREIARAGHPWIALRLDDARERTCGLERGHLLIRGGEPFGELRCFLGVFRGGGHGQERATPVRRSAGEDIGEVPPGARVPAASLDLPLDDPAHPSSAHRYGAAAVDER